MTRILPVLAKLAMFITVALVLIAAAPRVQAATLTVCASGCDHSSIQSAVNAASSGDTLLLERETFVGGNIVIDRNLTIQSTSGFPTIDGNGSEFVFEIQAGVRLWLRRVTLIDATRAVLINRGRAYLTHVSVVGQRPVSSTHGGILNHAEAYLELYASVVAGHLGTQRGGGITNFGDLQVRDSTLSSNIGFMGGGIFNSLGRVSVTNSSIQGNHASKTGGAYANIQGGAMVVFDSLGVSNTADEGCDLFDDWLGTPSCVN